MKTLLSFKVFSTLLLLIFLTGKSIAQSVPTDVGIIQEAFGFDKKVIVANSIQLEGSAINFWNIYDTYELERKKLGKQRIQIISEYANNYPNISDEKIVDLFKRTQTLKKSFDKLMKTSFKKIKKEVGVKEAAQFWQIETYFSSIIQAEIYSKIPFIGDNLEKSK